VSALELSPLEDHLIRMKETIEEVRPHRVVVDSLSALERVSTLKSFREFVIGLTSFVKHQEITALFTSTTETLMFARPRNISSWLPFSYRLIELTSR